MLKPIAALPAIVIILLFTCCAAPYKKINPPNIKYPAIDIDSVFTYQYDVIRRAGNKKMAKKEAKAYMHVVAVRIHNNTEHTLQYGQNYKIYSGNSEVNLMGPAITGDIIRQKAAFHLFYLLLTPMQLQITSGYNQTNIPIGLLIGPALAFGNLGVAASANNRFKAELLQYDLENKMIAPGETVYGLITVRDNGFMPLSLRIGR
jgi:hypothetical protein